ncbi:MAG: zinc-ribbon domain-containing protein [Pseudomonadota bacterium]|nr:zinc-ribbon domain-containing protein [Pseudomonadota bacterium]
MILNCPSCKTRYLIDSFAIGDEGRQVRCANCGHGWRQFSVNDRSDIHEELSPIPEGVRPIPRGSNLPALPRDVRRTEAASWLMVLFFIAVTCLIVVIGRNAIVAKWPPAERLYTTLGLSLDIPGQGLDLENLTATAAMIDGTRQIEIKGEIRNVATSERAVPDIRAMVIDPKSEDALAEWLFLPGVPRLPRAGTHSFVVRQPDPGLRADRLILAFER